MSLITSFDLPEKYIAKNTIDLLKVATHDDKGRVFTFFFPSFEAQQDVDKLIIVSGENEGVLSVTAETLSSSTVSILSMIAVFFETHEDTESADDEIILTILGSAKLHFCRHGNHVRVTDMEHEVAYWVCDEFSEAAGEVLGALMGLLYGIAKGRAL